MQESIFVNRGFQLLNTFNFNHQIKCVSQQASESVVAFYYIGSDNVINVCPYKQNEQLHKYSLKDGVTCLIYSKKYRLFVASCPDLALRIFNEHFELLDTVHITATVLSLTFNEATSELYTGGVGCVNTWKLRHQLHNPLVPSTPLQCSIESDQWVMCLDFNGSSGKLVVVCQTSVHIVVTKTRKQIYRFASTHRSSLTRAVLFDSMEYLITGAKDGSIKVWNCILKYEVHTFTGHMKAVTGLKAHPSAPCVISCSMDGTIRSWHLENMTECCRVDCGDGVLGMCSDFPAGNRLCSYSNHEIRLWEVNQLETHFTTINSNVVSMFQVSCSGSSQPGLPARIVALAEDDGLRLLSPVSGQILTILFPMFSAQMLEDVVYLLAEERLLVLLHTGTILVVSTSTNPCSTVQLWTSAARNIIYCMATVTLLLEDDTTQPVVFVGQHSGDIALIYTPHSRLSMPLPCPSHDGPVIKLIGSCDPIHLAADRTNYALVSYGEDKMLNVWSIEIDKASNITLRTQISINLEQGPSFMCLLQSAISMTMENSLVVLNLHKQEDHQMTPSILSFHDIPLLIHQKEDDHNAPIISLACSQELKLFATSSKDGMVKIWTVDNQLVSELEFGELLAAVCFANSRGDLLVGFQKHVCSIKAEDYLTSNYVDLIRGLPFNERGERPITFDPELEFWYDSERVPSLPAEQELRDQLSAGSLDTVLKLKASSLQTITDCREESGLPDKESLRSANQLQNLVDKKSLAQIVSQHYTKVLRNEGKKSQVSLMSSHASSNQQHNSDSSISTLSRSSGVLSLSNPSLHTITPHSSTPLVQVTPLQSPSVKLPIAPDCLIPNSVIRSKIGYVPPVVTSPRPYKPPKLRQRITSDISTHSFTSTLSHSQILEEDVVSCDWSLPDEPSREIVTCVSSFAMNREDDKLHVRFSDEVMQRDSSDIAVGKLETIHHSRKPTQLPSPSLSIGSRGTSTSSIKSGQRLIQSECSVDQPPKLSANMEYRRQSGQFRTPSNSSLSRQMTPSTVIIAPELTQKVSVPPSRGAASTVNENHQSSNTRRASLTPVVMTPLSASTKTSQEGTRKRKSSLKEASTQKKGGMVVIDEPNIEKQGRRLSKGVAPDLAALNEMDEVGLLIQRICGMSWFPKSALKAAGLLSVDQVFAVLMVLLKSSQLPIFKEVCRVLLELNKLRALNDGHLTTFSLRLVDRHNDTEKTVSTHPLRMEILRALKQLGLFNKEVLSLILLLLTDSNLEIHKAAFVTLRSITGISRKSQLHRLLLDLGLLQHVEVDEDEIIEELAERVRNGLVSPPSNTWSKSRAVKAQLSPLASHTTISQPPIVYTTEEHTHTSHGRQLGLPPPTQHSRRHTLPFEPTRDTAQNQRRATYHGAHVGSTQKHHRDSVHSDRKHPITSRMDKDVAKYGPKLPQARGMDLSQVESCSNGIQQLMMTNPHTFPQCPQAMGLMLGSKVKSEPHSGHVVGYKWSEVHTVIENSLARGSPNEQAMPRLGPVQDCVSEYKCMANLMTRRLLSRLKERSQRSLSRSSSRKERKRKGGHLVISLPKLTCS